MTLTSESGEFPRQGRLLGIDYGAKRLGLAVSNAEQTIASPLENYTRRGPEADARHLRDVVQEYGAAGLVVGLPVHISGEEGGKARETRAFGEWLAGELSLPLCFWDERYTSSLAEDHLREAELSRKRRKARLDKLAAQFTLQSFLEASDRDRPPPSLRE